MLSFADGVLLEEVSARGELDDRLVTKLADQIKAFHNDAEQYRAQSGHDHIAAVISGNRASMARFGEILPAANASSLVERQREQAKCHAELLDARARQGRVRTAHGALHLAHIAVIYDQPVLFQCIRFAQPRSSTL